MITAVLELAAFLLAAWLLARFADWCYRVGGADAQVAGRRNPVLMRP